MSDPTYLHDPTPAEKNFRSAYEADPYGLETVSEALHQQLSTDHIVSVIAIYSDCRLYMGTFTSTYDAVQAVRDYNAQCAFLPGIIQYDLLHHYRKDTQKRHDDTSRKPPAEKKDDWPEPNYERLQSEGIPVDVLYWRKRVYDSLPDRPLSTDANERFHRLVRSLRAEIERVTAIDEVFDFNAWLSKKGYLHQLDSGGWVEGKQGENVGIRPAYIPTDKESLHQEATYAQFCGLYDKRLADLKVWMEKQPNMSLMKNRIRVEPASHQATLHEKQTLSALFGMKPADEQKTAAKPKHTAKLKGI